MAKNTLLFLLLISNLAAPTNKVDYVNYLDNESLALSCSYSSVGSLEQEMFGIDISSDDDDIGSAVQFLSDDAAKIDREVRHAFNKQKQFIDKSRLMQSDINVLVGKVAQERFIWLLFSELGLGVEHHRGDYLLSLDEILNNMQKAVDGTLKDQLRLQEILTRVKALEGDCALDDNIISELKQSWKRTKSFCKAMGKELCSIQKAINHLPLR